MANAGQDKISAGIVLVGAIFTITVVAGFSRGLGKVVVLFMFGVLFLWMITNYPLVNKWINGVSSVQGNVGIPTKKGVVAV